ncbi:MAG: bifunctional methylenetetrahydrofolate dehydrogenase/methenyltetrahydrofolate cyclohydrolase FolD, partial [Coxiella sp. (in: Bacteria)]
MSARIIDGKAVAAAIKSDIAAELNKRDANNLPTPGLDVILVGENPASEIYVKHKQNACKAVGIRSTCHRLPKEATSQDIATLIQQCNDDPKVHGILLQLPLPGHIDSDDLLELIHPDKDVDGFHPYNLGRLVQRRPRLRPCTPKGVITLLESTGEDIVGKDAVVIGASNIVGRPMALELLLAKCTPTICHRFTKDLEKQIRGADILISATGCPGIINSDWIKPGAIVIDVGFSRLSNGKISGDIEFETAKERAGWITPVPGGVGPMTIATLLQNTLKAAELQD